MLGVAVLLACADPREEWVDGPSLASLAAGARFWSPTCELALGSGEPVSGEHDSGKHGFSGHDTREHGAVDDAGALVDGWARADPGSDWRWSTGHRADLWWDALGEPLELGVEAWAYAPAAEDGRLRVEVSAGGSALGAVELSEQPAEHWIALPAGALAPGRNLLTFVSSSAAPAPGEDPRLLAAGWRRIRARLPGGGEPSCAPAIGRFEDDGLHLPLGTGVDLHFDADASWLVLGALNLAGSGSQAGPQHGTAPDPRLEVHVERVAQGPSPVATVPTVVTVSPGDRDVRLELPPGSGPVRLTMVARAGASPPTTADPGTALRVGGRSAPVDPGTDASEVPRSAAERRQTASLIVRGGRLAFRPADVPDRGALDGAELDPAAGGAGRARHAEDAGEGGVEPERPSSGIRPNVLIYLVDTLRADHLGSYGYDRPTSPRLDAFAAQGILFERAVAQSSWTRPAVATVLTGLDPRVHGVHGRGDRLAEEITTLPERLQEMGYDTAAVITNGNVSAPFGFRQGFDAFTYLPERPSRGRHRRSRQVTEWAASWLAERVERGEQRPFFLYLHTTDPHAPYAPHPVYRKRFLEHEPAPRLGTLRHLGELTLDPAVADPQTVADLRALYDAEIAYNDHWFGALLDRLEELGLADDTLVIFLADHGEEFGEHGGWQHGHTLYQEQLHVPLVMRLPGGASAGTRRSELVRQTDLVPTVLEVVGAAVPPGLQGRSLLPTTASSGERAPASDPGPVFAILDLDGRRLEAALDGSHKLVRATRDPMSQPRLVELYDLAADPGERDDLSLREQVWVGYLEALLRSRSALWPSGAVAEEAVVDDALAEELRALGYVH